MKTFLKLLAFLYILLPGLTQAQPATILPPAETTFFDGAGTPYAGGQVYFYIPNTSTPKTTWQDAAETIPNSNPVILDANGRALIYGSGVYRQVLQDSCGNTIWDQLTTDVYSLVQVGTAIWGGTATGSANALILTTTPTLTALTEGQLITFIAATPNSTATTENVDGLGSVDLRQTTAAGIIDLVPNNLVAGGRYFEFYDGSEFVLVNPSTGGSGDAFANLASASTTDLGTVATKNINITGSATITSFGSTAALSAPLYNLTFSGSLQLIDGPNLNLPNSQNLTTQAGDYGIAQYQGSGVWQLLAFFPASGYIGRINPLNYDSAGTYTYVPSPNLLYETVELVGGGGGGGGTAAVSSSASSSGGSGAYIKALETSANVGSSQTITIGAGGTAGSTGTSAGGTGGTTSFGSLLSATGGVGGGANTSGFAAGGVGGAPTISVGAKIDSMAGQKGGAGANSTIGITGPGGSNPLGFGGNLVTYATGSGPGVDAAGNGSGGSGASSGSGNTGSSQVGGVGADGAVIITEFCSR